jgi:hypothetical protein
VEGAVDLWDPALVGEEELYYSTTHGWWNARPGRQPIHGVRVGRWVLHHAPQGGDWKQSAARAAPGGQVRLYDVEQDPLEQVDLAESHPEIVADLQARLARHLARQAELRTAESFGAGSATLRMLGAIGYLGEDESEPEPETQDSDG